MTTTIEKDTALLNEALGGLNTEGDTLHEELKNPSRGSSKQIRLKSLERRTQAHGMIGKREVD